MSIIQSVALLGASGSGGAAADLGATIDQSLRFQRTQFLKSAAITTSTFTVSIWVKIGRLRNPNVSGGVTSIVIGTAGTAGHGIGFSNNKLYSSHTGVESTEEFRDPSAWYHLVANSTGNIYINNKLILSGGGLRDPSSQEIIIGHIFPNTTQQSTYSFDGLLADFYLIDGSELTPSSFARTNDDGVWVPDTYTGSFGTNGAHLVFDSSAGLGDDTSGNGNDYTATNFDTTSISSSNTDNDIDYNDTPTNNHATPLPLLARSSSITFEQANLRSQFGGGGSHSGMAGFGIVSNSGKYYWEVIIKEQMEGTLGIVSDDFDLEAGVLDFSDDAAGWGWKLGQAVRENDGTEVSSSHSITVVDDVIGFLLDTTAGTCTIEINGVAQTSGNGAEYTNIPTDKTIYPYFRIGGASGDANFDFNFGQMPFLHEPSGYQHVATNNLPEPTIKNGRKHFGVLTYTAPASPSFPITINGNGGNNGTGTVDFDPDLIWIKMINGTQNHILFDRIRGKTNSLRPDATIAEVTTRSNFDFATNGFTFSAADAETYQANDSYVAWCWSAPDTWASTDADVTAGTIASSGRRNKDAGFSIVSYTGDSDGAGTFDTIAHGLQDSNGAVTPDLIIVKGRNFADEWHVKHVDMNNADSIRLNISTVGADFNAWNNTAPNSNVFTVGPINGTNKNGAPFIAYCWKSIEGYSKFGSYTANGSTDGPFVYLGFRPQLVITKTISGTNDSWTIWDSTRGTYNPNKFTLVADSQARDVLTGNDIDFLSNGFKLRNTIGNVSSGQYVYLAWAENPFGGENAPPATAR